MKKNILKTVMMLTIVVSLLPSNFALSQQGKEDLDRPVFSYDKDGNRKVMELDSYGGSGQPINGKILSQATYPEFSIQPQTVLHISLKGDESKLEDPGLTVKVSTDGTIRYPYLGEVKVLYMNEDELELKLEKMLEKDYVRAPQVEVTIVDSLGYWLLGEVTTPGRYDMPLDREITLREGIMLAGGYQQDRSGISLFRDEWTKIQVTRTENNQRKLFEFKISEVPEDFVIKPDDIILCRYGQNEQLGSYYIFGEVQWPGKYPIVKKEYSGQKLFNRYGNWASGSGNENFYPTILGSSNVVDAIFGAQYLTDNAARNNVYLVRKEKGKTKRYRIPMGHIYYKGDADKYNMELEDGDVITVSESWF